MKHILLKTTLSTAMVFFLMGNTKCEQQADIESPLKKNVRVVGVGASSFMDNSSFSFSEVAQSQFSGVLNDTSHFYERTIYPEVFEVSEQVAVNQNGVQKLQVVSKPKLKLNAKSVEKLKSWFPQAKAHEVQLKKDSWCFITRPQHNLIAKINSLEAHSGGKLEFGFSQASVVPVPISGKFALDRMRMDLSFHAYDTWTQQNVASKNNESMKNDYKVGLGIDFGLIHIGPEFYRATGLSEVTLKGLRNGVNGLAQELFKNGEDWKSHVMVSRDNYVVIVGGKELGIKKGDQFAVYNKTHNWRGDACGGGSVLVGSVTVSDMKDPWIIEIEDADTQMSKARVLNVKEDTSIDIGAVVKIHKLTPRDSGQMAGGK